jgi:hypothetical protein
MNAYSGVILDKSELAQAIHEGIHTRPRAADHQRHLLLRRAILRQEQKQARQSLFGTIEELVNEVGLGVSHICVLAGNTVGSSGTPLSIRGDLSLREN